MPDLAKVSSVGVADDPHTGTQIWIGCGNRLCSWQEKDIGNSSRPPPGKIAEWGEEQGLAKDLWEGVFLDRAGTLWAGGRDHVAALLGQSR
jgi:hypothetical protein